MLKFANTKSKTYHWFSTQGLNFWMPDSINCEVDLKDWNILDSKYKFILKGSFLAFIRMEDEIIENVESLDSNNISIEQKAYYKMQELIEMIHLLTYQNITLTFFESKEEMEKMLILMPKLEEKRRWIGSMKKNKSKLTKIILAIFDEGLFFSSPFANIFLLRIKGLMKVVTGATEYISRDENFHLCQFIDELKDYLSVNHLSINDVKDEFYKIMEEAVNVEVSYGEELLSNGEYEVLTVKNNTLFIKHIANMICTMIGFKPFYDNVYNPYSHMQNSGLTSKVSEFEREVLTNYTHEGFKKNVDDVVLNFSL